MNKKISDITEKVFFASIRNARLEPNYDNIYSDPDKGIYIELDGAIDSDSIDVAFENEKKNLKNIADDISKQLIKDDNNKRIMQEQFGMNVDEIDSSKYKIIHDDKKNLLFLFLPVSAVNSQKQKEEENAKTKEDDERVWGIVADIRDKLKTFVDDNKIEIQIKEPKFFGKMSAIINEKTTGKTIKLNKDENYAIDVKIERTTGKRLEQFETNLYLKIKYENKTIYDKYVRNILYFKEFNLLNPSKNGNKIELKSSSNKQKREFSYNIANFQEKIVEKDYNSIEAFYNDLNTPKVQEKIRKALESIEEI